MSKQKRDQKKGQPDSDLYKKTENVVELLDNLRDAFIAYKESTGRCKLELKSRGTPTAAGLLAGGSGQQEEFRNFYLPPKVPLLEEPEKQKRFRREYIQEVGSRPSPEPLALLADSLHLEALQTIADRSKPSQTRQDLAAFYQRLAVGLQHKKYKMLGRWACQLDRAEAVNGNAAPFDKAIGRLQEEIDSALSRAERLQVDDSYDAAVDPTASRPQPTSKDQEAGGQHTLLYVEAPEKCINSVVRQDDIEVHLRIQTYRNKLFRTPEKLAASIKWLPYSHRFDVWRQSRVLLNQTKVSYTEKRFAVMSAVEEMAGQKLVAFGVVDDKLLKKVTARYVQHLAGDDVGRREEYLTSHRCAHEKPPFLCTSNTELNRVLIPLAKEYKLNVEDSQGLDDGTQFTYQVVAAFPTRFQLQVRDVQFDWLDSGEGTQADTDILLIQKLTSELGLDKNEMLVQMARQAEIERNKSILGKLGKEQHQGEGGQGRSGKSSDAADQSEDIARANLIRRIRELKFFSLEETEYKLKSADWLKYVCWQPAVSDGLKRQNQVISSPEQPLDAMLISAFEFIDVNEMGAANKILEDSATAHVGKVRAYFTEISQKTTWAGHEDSGAAVEAILRDATLGESAAAQAKKAGAGRVDEPSQYNPAKAEEYLRNIDPMKQHLIKSYYSLRLLKSREIKARLIQALNYYRGVQKRLAHDVREFFTRERGLGGQYVDEALIGPQFGTDEQGNLKAKKGGSSGPGGINANRLQRDLDDGESNHDEEGTPDPVSLKGYKYNRRFNPALTATCPCVPRLHTTFGRPTLYEEVSQELERRQQEPSPWRGQASPIPAYKDRLIFKESSGKVLETEICVLDEHGIKVVYEEAINDMIQLEEEMMKIGSYYLNKAEFAKHCGISDQPFTMLDRGQVALDLLERELDLQVAKIKQVQMLIDVYENTCDPLESVRLIQMIADTMAVRPRINIEANYFKDSYESETEVLRQKFELFSEVLNIQRATEQEENERVRRFQELKVRKLQDFLAGKWAYKNDPAKVERMGAKEEQIKGAGQEVSAGGRKAQALKEQQRQLALKEIAERHITEFAGDQHTDFANVLGLPEVTANDLFQRQGQQDPIVIDTIRAHAHFSKQIEGYPWFFSRSIQAGEQLGLQSQPTGLTDFYESLCAITRVHAATEQAFAELGSVHRPEHGLAASCLERALLLEARGRLKVIRMQVEEGVHSLTKSSNLIQNDFYLGSADKLTFLMREFKADLHPDWIERRASPLLVSKLSVPDVAKFDFPRLKHSEIEGDDELNEEQTMSRMIAMAKVSITRQDAEPGKADDTKASQANSATQEPDGELAKALLVQSPSMLVMSCNTVEVLRLREELIRILHEGDVLAGCYQEQITATERPWKIVQPDGRPFETQAITKDNMNFVDINDGSKKQIDLAIGEFDPTLKSCLDFTSESCVKALMTDLGLEELRAVVHYQLMQRHLLAVAVMRNQALMDGPQQGLSELKLLERGKSAASGSGQPLTVPNSIVDLNEILNPRQDGSPSTETMKAEQSRLTSNLTKEVGEAAYSIAARKARHRPTVNEKYGQVLRKVTASSRSAEAKLRVLRAYRLRLVHEYCQDVLEEVYWDSISIQTLQACRELRRKACLFPEGSQLFTIGQGAFQEHVPHALQLGAAQEGEEGPKITLEQLLKGGPKTLFYVPHSKELVGVARTPPTDLTSASGGHALNLDNFSEDQVDAYVKAAVQPPEMIPPGQTQNPNSRPCAFKNAYQYKSTVLDLMQYYSLILQTVSLEYLMGRNHTPGSQILALEGKILTGQEFWKADLPCDPDKIDPSTLQNGDKKPAERVIAKIMNQKRARVDLAEDIGQVAQRLREMNEFLKSNNSEHLKLPYLLDLLRLQHQSSYLHFMNGCENALDIYLDHHSDDNFAKVQDAMTCLARRDLGFNLLGNGFYMCQGSRNALEIKATSRMLRDYDQFAHCYQPMVDENALVPPKLPLIRRLYGISGHKPVKAECGALCLATPDYRDMSASFFNMDDEQRSFIATNFYQLEEGAREYLVFKELIPPPNAKESAIIKRPKEILQAKVEYLGGKVEARHLQRVLMSWITTKSLPNDTKTYQETQKLYREQTMLKILLERDRLTELYYEAKEEKKDKDATGPRGAAKKRAKERGTILESVDPTSREHTVISRMFQTKAEIVVTSRVLDVEMIRMSLQMITEEQESLMATFEQGAAEGRVHAKVHPQQQYASTLYQSVDKNSHLDVVNKLEFVQSFLTKLRNRCTEVETLASGPGIVFSMKDFNECLQVFCQGLLKYGEGQLRTRVETQHIRQNQFQHLLYMKEKQALYYRRKCEQFLGDIDKLVNAKISQKGSQLIYELDVASRELRVLRDNYRLMQTMVREELRHDYVRAIRERDDKMARDKIHHAQHRQIMNEQLLLEYKKKFAVMEKCEDHLRKRPQESDFLPPDKKAEIQANRMITQGETNQDVYERGQLEEILRLNDTIRKMRYWNMIRNVTAHERQERELANQRAQLTSNAALWDQLAEAEKREQITKQELNLTKLSLASYVKLIEKLQGQLESLNNQKALLQQYKNSKSKRMDELENKNKDLEILENIDLNRILNELKSRDKRIENLETENRAQKYELTNVITKKNPKNMMKLQTQLEKEKELKLQAYDRLEGMRVEMRALEGKDMKSDLWKEKCRELFDICKDLERENDDLRGLVKDANQAHLIGNHEDFDKQPGIVPFGSSSLQEPHIIDPSRSTGAASHAQSNLYSRAGDRLFSSRTLAAGVPYNMERVRHSSGFAPNQTGGATLLPGQSYPLMYQGAQDPEVFSSQHPRTHMAKGIGAGGIPSGHNATHPETTLHSEQYLSQQFSGMPHNPNMYEGPEVMSLGAAGYGIDPTLNSAAASGGNSQAGVFGPPLALQQPGPRGIMTAGVGTRPGARGDGHKQFGVGGIKGMAGHGSRLLTSQGPPGGPQRQGAKSRGSMGLRNGAGKTQPGSLQTQTRMHYASQNPGALSMAGVNVQGLGAGPGVTSIHQKNALMGGKGAAQPARYP